MRLRAVGFDYLGVVATLPSGDFFDEMARVAATTRHEVEASYLRYRHAFQVGQITEEDVWRRVAADLGAQSRFETLWRAAMNRLPSPDPGVLTLVDHLRAALMGVGLLSNLAAPTSWSKDLYDSGTAGHFDVILLSGDTGYAKPEPEAFRMLADRLLVLPAELVFIDDRAEALSGIEKLGIHPVLYQGLPDLRKSLVALGITLSSST